VQKLIDIYIKGKNQKAICVLSGEINDQMIEDYSGMSNNQCEWKAVVQAMDIISGEDYNDVNIHIDSVLVYKQINFLYHIKSKKLKKIYFEWNRYKNILSGREINYKYISGQLNPAREFI